MVVKRLFKARYLILRGDGMKKIATYVSVTVLAGVIVASLIVSGINVYGGSISPILVNSLAFVSAGGVLVCLAVSLFNHD